MLNPILQTQNEKVLGEQDIPRLRHEFMKVYGWISEEEWEKTPLDLVFTLWPFVNKEVVKEEELRLATLKFYGVKNPK